VHLDAKGINQSEQKDRLFSCLWHAEPAIRIVADSSS
jgi:hypothetical protein